MEETDQSGQETLNAGGALPPSEETAVKAEPSDRAGLKQELFRALYENLCAVKPEYRNRDVVLCPICLREISKDELLKTGFEHIIPQNVIKQDPPEIKSLGVLNQRCGITILCRTPRSRRDGKGTATDGCNGLKGSLYDRLFRGKLGIGEVDKAQLDLRHGVATLVMAYLGAFQRWGYAYILRPELDEIREQFDFPDTVKTAWLQETHIFTGKLASPIVMTQHGNPFAFSGRMTPKAPLEVTFRRFQARLPNGVWPMNTLSANPVDALETLLPKLWSTGEAEKEREET